MKKIIISLILIFLFSSNTFAFNKGLCSKDLIVHQNLRASKIKYIKNGKYDWYTRGIVKEAHVLQKHLNRLGFDAGAVDGIIGPKTRKAILRLQKYLGTTPDGYVGPKTRALLNNSCGGKNNQKNTKNKNVAFEKEKNKNKTTKGEEVIKVAHKMAIVDKIIVRGSCWDFLDRVYTKAGYDRSKRKTIFHSYKKGPYANIDLIQPGDWLYYINHSYHNVEHSGLFIKWINKKKKIAKILSYAGQNRKIPGRYREFDLSSVYNIMRPK